MSILIGLVGCSPDPRPDPPAVDSVTVAAIRAESVRAATVAARPPSALWDLDRVSERLVRAGVNPRTADTIPEVPGYLRKAAVGRFRVGRGGDLLVFLFADSLARREVSLALDPERAAPVGEVSPWGPFPMLIVSNNLIAVLRGGSSSLRERVQLALEAGLPSS